MKTKRKSLSGLRIMVTAGPTVEHIDPIRVITNRSSGKMGVAIAREALSHGAEVVLIYGPGSALPPKEAKIVHVETTEQMYEVVISELRSKRYHIVIAAAAAADWAPQKSYSHKVPTHGAQELNIKLKPTPKIIDSVKKISPKILLVPFKAEFGLPDEEMIDRAYNRLKQAKADLIAVNDVGREGVGFGVDTNEIFIVDKHKNVIHVPLTTKKDVAKKLLDVIAETRISRNA